MGGGICRSEIKNGIACIGYGPAGNNNSSIMLGADLGLPGVRMDGLFARRPIRVLAYHAFNLTREDTLHHAWPNLEFTDDLRFETVPAGDILHVGAAAGVPPFTKRTICAKNPPFPRGGRLLYLASHTHKRGEFFCVEAPDGTRLYENPFYADPIQKVFDPPLLFDSPDPAERTLTYCAIFQQRRGVRRLHGPPDCHPLVKEAGAEHLHAGGLPRAAAGRRTTAATTTRPATRRQARAMASATPARSRRASRPTMRCSSSWPV